MLLITRVHSVFKHEDLVSIKGGDLNECTERKHVCCYDTIANISTFGGDEWAIISLGDFGIVSGHLNRIDLSSHSLRAGCGSRCGNKCIGRKCRLARCFLGSREYRGIELGE